MAQEPSSRRADQLIDLAQAGEAKQALELAEREIAAAGPAPHPALHFARAVAYEVMGEHRSSAAAAGDGIEAARRDGRDGWRAACLAMRAVQRISSGERDPEGYEESSVMRDLAQAQVALLPEVENAAERITACCNLAAAYTRLRLYELAVPMYLRSAPRSSSSAAAADVSPEARVVQQLNLATLHLTWALELHQVGLGVEAAAHCELALGHALDGERSAAGAHRETWAERSRLFAACARAQRPDGLAAVDQVRQSISALGPVGADYEQALAAPLLGLALAASGRQGEGLRMIGAALAATDPDTDPVVLAATQYARLVLIAPTSEGARAGLELSRTLSRTLWRQRNRRLNSAEELLRYERLQAELESVSRDSDRDALTGTAARRALDRRMTVLGARHADQQATICVLVIDLDRFKRINDDLGHQVGDLVLHGVGQALSGSLRGEDLVGRFGGDEFVALLSSEPRDGRAVADRMLAAVRRLEWPAEVTVRPTMSIGVAVTDPDLGLDQALAAADRAMYLAKRSGGDTVMVAETSAASA